LVCQITAPPRPPSSSSNTVSVWST